MSNSLVDAMREFLSGGSPDDVSDLSISDLWRAFLALGPYVVKDESTTLDPSHVIKFTGAGVSAANSGGEYVVTISGGGGGGSFDPDLVGASGDDVLTSHVTGDADKRWILNAEGKQEWGDGTNPVDTNLYRSAANKLKTDDALDVAGTLGALGNATVGGTLGITGTTTAAAVNCTTLGASSNATVGGTLGITGTTTAAAVNCTTLGASSNATVGGTLGITGTTTAAAVNCTTLGASSNATVGGTLGITGTTTAAAVNATTLSSSGATSPNSLAVTNNATVGGTLGITGTTTAAAVNCTTLGASSNATVGGTLGITGTTTAAAVNATTLSSSGATSPNSLAVTNNATVGGTFGVTGTTTAAAINASGIIAITAAATSTDSVNVKVTGDADKRIIVNGNGTVEWGDGTNPVDTNLYRTSADKLKTDDALDVTGTLAALGNATVGGTLGITGTTTAAAVNATTLSSSGATSPNSLAVTNNATVGGTLGITGTTTAAAVNATTLSSSGATSPNSLAVTNNATVGGTLGVTGTTTAAAITASGTVTLNAAATTIASGNTFTWGGDTTLYRSAADTLKTDDAFIANGITATAGSVFTGSNATAGNTIYRSFVPGDAVNRITLAADGKHLWSDGTNAGDTNLYRSAADTLKTDDSLIVQTNLTVNGTSSLVGAVTTTGALTVGTDLAVGGIGKTMFVYKASDESVTSSTTLQNDDELVSPTLTTSAKYLVECQVFYTSASATPGIKFSWVGPTSATMVWGAGAGYVGNSTIGGVDSWAISAGAFDQALYTGILVTAGSTGTLQLQWAQSTSNGTASTVKAGSWLRLTRVV